MIKAVVLDKSHRLLMDGSGSPIHHASTMESLRTRLAEEGLKLGPPVGSAPPEYAFLSPEDFSGPFLKRAISLRDASRKFPDVTYWNIYTRLMLGGYVPPTRDMDVFHFGNSPFMAAYLAHFVVKGKKRATSGNPITLQKFGMTIPTPGLVSLITDGFGIPLCVIQTERVENAKFKDVPEAVAIGEAEGDMTLADWRHGHWEYFTKESKNLGLTFTEDTEVMTEWFRVLRVLGTSDAR